MRLYCQQGFSSRVVQALRTRLERTLRMAAEEGHGHGGSSRIRSRSRGRGAEADAANLGPENSTVLDSTGAGMGDVAGPPAGAEVGDGTVPLADGSVPPGGTMPEGTPGDVNAPFPPVPPVITPPGDVNAAEVLAVSTELARKISECSNRLANVSEELAITMEHFTQGRVEMKKGFEELSVQIQNQATCITTMTSGVSFQAGETTKLLKAFDRWAATGRWALTGNQSVEANIQGVQSEVEKQTKKLETNLSRGFDSIGRHLREMVKLLEERAQNAAAPDAVGDAGTPLRPGTVSALELLGLLGLQIREDQHHPDLPLPQQFHHFRQSQCESLWRSVRNSRTGRDQILPFRSQHRASVWASLPEMRERVYRGHCHRRHTVLNKPAESPVSGLPRDWG